MSGKNLEELAALATALSELRRRVAAVFGSENRESRLLGVANASDVAYHLWAADRSMAALEAQVKRAEGVVEIGERRERTREGT